MSITVRTLLNIRPINEGKLLAGTSGTDRFVESVTVLEVLGEYQFLEPNVLAISSLYAIAHDINEQKRIVHALNEHGASGLLLFNVGKVIEQVSPELISECERLRFPLIVMPLNISYFETLYAIIDCLLKQQNKKLKQYIRNYDLLINRVINTTDQFELLNTFQQIINKAVLVFDMNGDCIYKPNHIVIDPFLHLVSQAVVNEKVHVLKLGMNHPYPLSVNGRTITLAPIIQQRTVYGIIAILDCEYLSESERIALKQTQNLYCILEMNNCKLSEFRERIYREYIHKLLVEGDKSEESLINEGLNLDIDVASVSSVICIDIFRKEPLEKADSAVISMKHKEGILKRIRQRLDDFFKYSYVEILDMSIVVMYRNYETGNDWERRLFTNLERIVNQISSEYPCIVIAGIGKTCTSPSQIADSYVQARKSILSFYRMFRKAGCCRYEQIAFVNQMSDGINKERLRETYGYFLAPLQQYDAENDSDLLSSFQTLIECDLNCSEAARKMFVHRNTMLQRKSKIEEIFAYDVFSSENTELLRLLFTLGKIIE